MEDQLIERRDVSCLCGAKNNLMRKNRTFWYICPECTRAAMAIASPQYTAQDFIDTMLKPRDASESMTPQACLA